MKELFSAVCAALRRNENVVLCSIIASSGSTPRGSGAKMAVFQDGTTAGTIGGGAVEHESIKLAAQALVKRDSFSHAFRLSKNQTADIGMICGGQVSIYFHFLDGSDAAAVGFFEEISALYARQENTWLITMFEDDGVRGMAAFLEGRGIGAHIGAAIDPAAVQPLLCAKSMLHKGDPAYYVEPLTRAQTVYVFGGGHVSQELVPVLAHIGFSVVVFEDREAFAEPARFPGAIRTVLGDFSDIASSVAIRPADAVVIMTRGHQADFEVLSQVLRIETDYVGVIGSRHKIAATNARLLQLGIAQTAIERVHTPIGIPIGAQTPAEIAISIAAELIAHRAGLPRGGNA